jgi:hypothetical protein
VVGAASGWYLRGVTRGDGSGRSAGPRWGRAVASWWLWWALGCAGGEGEDAGETTTGTTGEPTPTPRFEGGGGLVSVGASRRSAYAVDVSGVIVGATALTLDGRRVHDLTPGSAVAVLSEDRLTLNFHGGLVAGSHLLLMINEGPTAPLLSGGLVVEVGVDMVPGVTAIFDAAPLASGDAIAISGAGAAGALAIVDAQSSPPTLAVHAREGAGWAASGESVAMPGYVHVAASPGFAALRRAGDGGAVTTRVVWRQSWPGAAVVGVESTSPAAIVELLASPAPITSPLEWAAYLRPHLRGDAVVVEMIAAVDSEAARPGDRRLVTRRWGSPGLGAPDLLYATTASDLEGLGAALDLAALARGDGPELALRIGRSRLGVARLDRGGLWSLEAISEVAPLGLPGADEVKAAAILSALGGVNALVIGADGAAQLVLHDPNRAEVTAPVTLLGLPAAAPRGDLAVGLVDGFATFLIAYGEEAPVHAVISDGATGRVFALERACDAVGLAAELPEGIAPLPIACLAGGAVFTGVLRLKDTH